MTAVDVTLWAMAAIAIAVSVGIIVAIGVLVARFMQEQIANLAAHRARKAQEIAEAKAAEQRAELEAADILERRVALPVGTGTISLGEKLEQRLDNAAAVIAQLRKSQEAIARQVTSQGAQLTALLSLRDADRQRVTHTDTPLRAEEER